jgi:hypothetical protein
MEPEGSLPCLKAPSPGSYPDPNQSNLKHSVLSKIQFNIILTYV